MLRTLFDLGDRIGLIPSVIVCGFSYLGYGFLVMRAIPEMLWQYPTLAYSLDMIVILWAGLSGLFWLWLLAELIEFHRRGYRLRWVTGNEWVYEEQNKNGERQYLSFTCKDLSTEYRPPRIVYLFDEVLWKSQTPEWAQERRLQIVERIADGLGANQGVAIQFQDQERTNLELTNKR